MASRLPLVFFLLCTAWPAPMSAAEPSPAPGEQVLSLEKQWASAIQRRDVAAMDQFLGGNYFLAIGVQGESLKVIPRAAWLAGLKDYDTKSFTIDDAQAHVYGHMAVVLML